MTIQDILKMNPNSKSILHYNGKEQWSHCYFQLKKLDNDINENELPVLEDQYLADAGEPLENDNGDYVYNPNQEIKFEDEMTLGFEAVFSSDTFIGLIQSKVKELIDSGDISEDSEIHELWDELGLNYSRVFVSDLCYYIECDDILTIEEKDDDSLLWFTSHQMDREYAEFKIDEIKE